MHKLLALLLLLVSYSAFAQVNCPTFTRYGGYDQWEISPLIATVDKYPFDEFVLGSAYLSEGDFKNHSIAAGAILRFFTSENFAIRLKAVYTNRSIQDVISTSDTSGAIHTDDEKVTQTLFKVAPGMQWTYFNEHLSFYAGIELPYTFQSDLIQVGSGMDNSPLDSFPTYNTIHRTVPGGYSVGLGIFVGSTYYFTSWLGGGFEVSAAYQYTSIGGVITQSSTVALGNKPPDFISSSYEYTHEEFGFTPVQPLIFLTFRF